MHNSTYGELREALRGHDFLAPDRQLIDGSSVVIIKEL